MTITDRGRPVALLTGIRKSPLEQLVESGEVERPAANQKIWEMGPLIPAATEGEPTLSDALAKIRRDEKW